MKLAITGGLGFIGKHLLEHLNAENQKIKEVVLFVRKATTEQRKWIGQLQLPIQLVEGDIAQLQLENWLTNTDSLIHLAWASTPSLTGEDVQKDMALNWPASSRVIEACTKSQTKLIFLSSGGTVYGEPHYLPIDEDHPKNPISAYGKIKWKVEKEIMKTHNDCDLQFVILRPSNAYGPGFDNSKGYGIIGHWMKAISTKTALGVIKNDKIIRDFIFVGDLCTAILICLESENKVYNIGSGNSLSFSELKDQLELITKTSFEVQEIERRRFDVEKSELDISKVTNECPWSPNISISEGLFLILKKSGLIID